MTYCPICHCQNEPLGTLGSLTHYRCRACGLTYSHSQQEEA